MHDLRVVAAWVRLGEDGQTPAQVRGRLAEVPEIDRAARAREAVFARVVLDDLLDTLGVDARVALRALRDDRWHGLLVERLAAHRAMIEACLLDRVLERVSPVDC
jgi:hypothetical protein